MQPRGAEGQSAHSALQPLTSALWQYCPMKGTGTSHLFNKQPRVAGSPQQRWLLQSMFKYGLQGWTECPSHQVRHPLGDRVISSDGVLRNRKSQLSVYWKAAEHGGGSLAYTSAQTNSIPRCLPEPPPPFNCLSRSCIRPHVLCYCRGSPGTFVLRWCPADHTGDPYTIPQRSAHRNVMV